MSFARAETGGGVRFAAVLNAVGRTDAAEQHLPRTRTWMSWENERKTLPRTLSVFIETTRPANLLFQS